ncbi:MAG: flagellar hook-basal body complex protein [Acidobacteria bacterium]|nr:flagellar hook-basal body complex protein [Acidobacteriota bacterium]
MDALLTAAASGLRARIESLELLANNLANAATAGYKADREFYSTYIAPEALDGPGGTLPVSAPVVERNWIDFAQGVLGTTGSPLDFSIAGPGFFVIQSSQGVLYTRNGNFRINASGGLVTASGHAVLGRDGRPIRLDPDQTFQADPTGVIQQNGRQAAQLQIVDFADRSLLAKSGSTYFRYDGAGAAPQNAPARIEQGRLEGANFQPAEAAVRLVNVLRQFEMLQRAIALGAEMNRRAIEEVARIRE